MPKSKKGTSEHEDEHEERDEDVEEEDEEESEEEDAESEDEEESEEDDSAEAAEDSEEDDSDEDEDEEEDEDDEVDELLKRERKGKPDPKKAEEAIKKRKEKREGSDQGDENFITEDRMQEILAEDRKVRQEQEATAIARSLTKSPKRAELLVEMWKNRTFPKGLPLSEQIIEMYAASHAKKLIGEKNEALRALRNKGRVSKDSSTSHRKNEGKTRAPKLTGQDEAAIKASGFAWKNNRWEKKLATGTLVRDPKSKRTQFIRNKS